MRFVQMVCTIGDGSFAYHYLDRTLAEIRLDSFARFVQSHGGSIDQQTDTLLIGWYGFAGRFVWRIEA